jgi:hypothetical protein
MQTSHTHFTEVTNAIDFFERASKFLHETHTNSGAWKWVLIALHGALYGFAICNCRGSDCDSVTTKKKSNDRHLISFTEALNRCQNPVFMNTTILSKPLLLNKDQAASIEKLQNTLRNRFMHFTPNFWELETSGLPIIATHCVEVIRFLALETGNFPLSYENQYRHVEAVAIECDATLRHILAKKNQ